MRILYIGGTGEISTSCIEEGVALGQEITVFNRGRSGVKLPPGVRQIVGDLNDDAGYRGLLTQRKWDVVCQFRAFDPRTVERDIEVFAGRVGQYVFISSASAYQKPPQRVVVTEDVPLENPYWPYSRAKAAMEAKLMEAHRAGKLPVTIVRPSHTYRLHVPVGIFVSGDLVAWRLLQGQPVIVHGDGTSLWTMTSARDFAVPFARLLGNAGALGEAFHITQHLTSWSWDHLMHTMAGALGVEAKIAHVPSEVLVRYKADWAGPLLGDKTWSVMFDNSKVASVAGAVPSRVSLAEGFAEVARDFRRRLEAGQYQPDAATHALLDRIIGEQGKLGGN